MPPFTIPPLKLTSKRLAPMTRQHELVLAILQNPALADSLKSLEQDASVRNQWAMNPLAAAEAAGFTFPGGTEIAFNEFAAGWNIEVRINEDQHAYVFGFDSLKGFYTK